MNEPRPRAGLSILIVDDNAEVRRLLALLLKPEGYRLLLARDGHEALRIADRVPEVALVILDVMMPGLDGLEVCRRLRQRPHYVPIILATALADEGHVLRGFEAGADDYVTKPFRKPEVLARVRSALRLELAIRQLVDAKELASVGAMAVTLGHEINNPLTTVVGNVELSLNSTNLDDKTRRRLAATHEAACRIRDLVDRLVHIKRVVTTAYIDSIKMLDLDGSCPVEEPRPPSPDASPEHREPTTPATADGGPAPSGNAVDGRGQAHEVLDRTAALARLEGDEELFAAAAGVFVEDLPRLLERIERATADGDARALELAAHELKGAAASLSAAATRAAAETLEQIGSHGNLRDAPSARAELERHTTRLCPILRNLAGKSAP